MGPNLPNLEIERVSRRIVEQEENEESNQKTETI
jgi:hypothetical protein